MKKAKDEAKLLVNGDDGVKAILKGHNYQFFNSSEFKSGEPYLTVGYIKGSNGFRLSFGGAPELSDEEKSIKVMEFYDILKGYSQFKIIIAGQRVSHLEIFPASEEIEVSAPVGEDIFKEFFLTLTNEKKFELVKIIFDVLDAKKGQALLSLLISGLAPKDIGSLFKKFVPQVPKKETMPDKMAAKFLRNLLTEYKLVQNKNAEETKYLTKDFFFYRHPDVIKLIKK